MPTSTARSQTLVRSRDGASRRSRSGSRPRSRHRESRTSSRSRSRFHFKHKERNFAAAICSMISIVILSVAMAEPKWISLRGGSCCILGTQPGSLHYLGVFQFFYNSKMDYHQEGTGMTELWYQYGPSGDDVLIDCVDERAVLIFKVVITFSFLTILSSMAAFLLDLTGPSGRILQRVHRNAIFSIISVAFCVVLNIFCYMITTMVEARQVLTKRHQGSKVEVTFDISFYLVSAAGGMSVFAVACNCFRRYPVCDDPPYQQLDNYDDFESLMSPNLQDVAPMSNMPPPPAYTLLPPDMPSASATPTEPASATPTEQGNATPTIAASTSALLRAALDTESRSMIV